MIYVYYCLHCDEYKELQFSIWADRSSVICENCGEKLQRVYTTPAVHFRGTGWTQTKRGLPNVGKQE